MCREDTSGLMYDSYMAVVDGEWPPDERVGECFEKLYQELCSIT